MALNRSESTWPEDVGHLIYATIPVSTFKLPQRVLFLKHKAGRTVKVRNSRYYDFSNLLSSRNEGVCENNGNIGDRRSSFEQQSYFILKNDFTILKNDFTAS